jgi:predicted AlkP superfamily phosphohydrolase/phosphomutase
MSRRPPVILIGLDATEIDLIDELVAAGRMPTMAALRRRGRHGRLQTQPTTFLSMVWPSFYASQPLGHHGWYFNKLWRAEHQRLEYVSPAWLPNRIFWEGLTPSHRVALLDLPFAARPPKGLNGVYINGWQCHDDFGRQEFPLGFRAELERRHGKARLSAEVFGKQTAQTLLAQRREVLESTQQFGDICVDLLRRERWDLFLACSVRPIGAPTTCGICRRSTRPASTKPCWKR